MQQCKICLLSSHFPHIRFTESGVCQYCNDYSLARVGIKEEKKRHLAEFQSLIPRFKERPYQVLHCLSGGKDSSYSLLLLTRVFKLKVLAFTLDNGFMPPETLQNIHKLTETLHVDHAYFKPDFSFLKRLYTRSLRENPYPEKSIERASPACISCIGLVKYYSIRTAIEKKIPFVGFGWTPGQAALETSVLKLSADMLRGMQAQLRQRMEKIVDDDLSPYFLEESHYRDENLIPYLVHPAALLDYDEKKILKELKALGWKKPKGVDANSTNCLLNSLNVESHIKKYGFNPYLFEISKLVREGHMTRAEGLKKVQSTPDAHTVRQVKQKLGL